MVAVIVAVVLLANQSCPASLFSEMVLLFWFVAVMRMVPVRIAVMVAVVVVVVVMHYSSKG